MYGSFLFISKSRLRHNIAYFRNLIGHRTRLLVNLKGNAYGHGAILTGKFLEEESLADYFGVAFTVEGVELRRAGIQTPVLVYQPPLQWKEFRFDLNLEPVIVNLYALKNLLTYLAGKNISGYPVHIKFDTGLHRSGMDLQELEKSIQILKNTSLVRPVSVFSHLAAAEDPAEDDFTRQQIALFEKYSQKFLQAFPGIMRHLGKSASVSRMPEINYDMVRPGFGIWGFSDYAEERKKLQPIAAWKSVVTQKRFVPQGETVGYNREYKTARDTHIVLIPVGYADGYLRQLGNKGYVNIGGKRYPVVGKVSMDMLTVDVGNDPVQIGDEVILMGDKPQIYDLARWASTSPYVVSTNISRRVKRIFTN